MKSENFSHVIVVRRMVFLCVALFYAAANSSFFTFHSSLIHAQYNVDRLITIGRSALYYEDYVLSMQYFNQAILVKPYLYEPWFFRGVAKYSLDDYVGAEADCDEALRRNPYVVSIYELRGVARIQQKKYKEAISDYTTALKYDPMNKGLWHNRVLCHLRDSMYDQALSEIDTMLTRWKTYVPAYMMRADAYMQKKDTTAAVVALDKSLEIDPYDGHIWSARSIISLSRSEWKESEEYLDKAIHLLPKEAGNYINRAMARFNQNNLRGAMADYDKALDLEPNSFLGHYNRGLLRAQVGDDNRAITDFDFVLKLEPDNMMALFNRAVLLDKTGDLNGAIRDYSKVIEEYPNFWTGLEFRASCYRRLGMTKQAEKDEFTVYKARLEKHLYGKQPRLNQRQMRKRSDEDPEKYNQLVMEDEQEMQHEYQSVYRGRVQNRKVEMELLPMFSLSFEQMTNEVRPSVRFDKNVDALNQRLHARTIYINRELTALGETQSQRYFSYIQSLSDSVAVVRDFERIMDILLLRAVAYAAIQNYDDAIEDLSTFLQENHDCLPALWLRAACQSRINEFQASEGTNVVLKNANVLADLNHALSLDPQNAYLLYNRATLYAQRQEYGKAIEDYTRALTIDSHMAEAYYNRGICALWLNQTEAGVSDLRKAGEMGIFTAYSIIKKYRR